MLSWKSTRCALMRAITCAFLIGLAQAAVADATVKGTITDANSGDPIDGVTVVISNLANFVFRDPGTQRVVASGMTDGSGNYAITIPLSGSETRHIVIEAAGPHHAPARYNFSGDLPCFFTCGPGGEIMVASGDVVNADIALVAGGTISGTITNAATGDPLPDAVVRQVDVQSGFALSPHFHGVADSNGDYTTPLATAPGHWFIVTEAAPGDNFAPKAWENLPCELGRCAIRDTDPLTVTEGQVSGIDFALVPGATISGILLPDDITRIVVLFDAAGNFLGSVLLPFDYGPEWTFDRLSGGSYYVELGPSSGPFIRMLHNGLPCPFGGCNRARGEPVSVRAGSSVLLDPIELTEGGRIEGELLDSATGYPLSVGPGSRFGTYDIIDGDGEVVGGGRILEIHGNPLLVPPSSGVPAGDYFIRTYHNWIGQGIGYTHPGIVDDTLPGYTDAVYPGVPCAGLGCNLAAATPVTVTAGETAYIAIGISTGSNITGSVADDATGAPIGSAIVKLVDAGNQLMATAMTDEFGEFHFGAFPEGGYYLRTAMSGQVGAGFGPFQHAYFDKVYGATDSCSEQLCDPTAGTEINLDGSNDAGPFELRVESGPVIFGHIIDELTDLPIPAGRVDVFDQDGDFIGAYRTRLSTAEYRTTALAPGDYTLKLVVSPAFSTVRSSSSNSSSSEAVYRTQAATGAAAVKSQDESDDRVVVTVGTQDVKVNFRVVDNVLDKIFKSDFEIEEY